MRRAVVIALAAGLGALALAATAAASTTPRQLATDGGWCWFADPRAVYHAGFHHRTYMGYISSRGDITVASFDHDTQASAATVIGPQFQQDDHASPAIRVRPDGRIQAFWSAHGGPHMYTRVSKNPEDVTSWGETRTVGLSTEASTFTYPNPLSLPAEGNRLYMFWRAHDRSPTYSTSDDGGTTWAGAHSLIDVPDQRPYVKYASDGSSRIDIAFTEGNPGSYDNGIHYAAYRDGALWHADGTKIASLADAPITPDQADQVYDPASGNGRAWVWDVADDSAGRPVIVYSTILSATDRQYRYARWDGEKWSDHEVVPAGPTFVHGDSDYSGGIVIDRHDPSAVYLSRDVDGVHEIERWRTPDGGASWTGEPVSADPSGDNVRPVVPRGEPAGGGIPVVWMHGRYDGYTKQSMSLLSLFTKPALPPPVHGAPEPVESAPKAPARPAGPSGRDGTALTIAVGRRVVVGKGRVKVAGVLGDTTSRAPVAGARLSLLARLPGKHGWHRIARGTAGRRGRVAIRVRVRGTSSFRFVFAGDPGHAAARSRVERIYHERAHSRVAD